MTAIWKKGSDGWRPLLPVGFPDEKTLQALIEGAPQLLPLSGSPRLTMVGKEVSLGGGYADLLAVEASGRLVVIEVKLKENPEARRAVVAQILAYAAFLFSQDIESLEAGPLGPHLAEAGVTTLASLVEQNDQTGSFDLASFRNGLEDSLGQGRFRLVLVLDDVPAELVRLVGYLETVASELEIDLVTVAQYEVAGAPVLVPQRVDPERNAPSAVVPTAGEAKVQYQISVEEFTEGIDKLDPEKQLPLRRAFDWAIELRDSGLARLLSYRGTSGRETLLPYLPDEDAGLVTIWNENGFSLSFWRSVFERRAAASIPEVEAAIAPKTIGQGNTMKEVSDEAFAALREAYQRVP